MELSTLIEKKLNQYAKSIIEGGIKQDEHALGEMIFYMTLRRVLAKKATLQDIGMLDAINDTLQEKGIIDSSKTFYK